MKRIHKKSDVGTERNAICNVQVDSKRNRDSMYITKNHYERIKNNLRDFQLDFREKFDASKWSVKGRGERERDMTQRKELIL